MQLVIGRIGKAHGIRGELNVGLRTDEPEERFAVGAVIATDPPERGPLTVRSARPANGRLVVAFEEVPDRNAAEQLQGTMLVIDSDELPELDDEDDFYDHELIGMTVHLNDDQLVGKVTDIVHGPGGDTLVVRRARSSSPAAPAVPDATDEAGVQGASDDAAARPDVQPTRASAEVLIPFVREIVPTIDREQRRITITPPEGLLTL